MKRDESVRTESRTSGRRAVRFAGVVIVTLALMALIPLFLVRLYVIPSASMETTLHGCPGCDNDRVIVDRMIYRFRNPHPGEVVVFTAGPDVWSNSEVQNPGSLNPLVRRLQSLGSVIGIHAPSGTDFVKRVIAVGGQTVSCCDQRNRVIVDGTPVDEPYLYLSPQAGAAQQPFAPVRVPPDHLFMMGDNRNESLDSRAPGNGPIPTSALAGKVRFILLPFSRLNGIGDANPQLSDH